MNLQFVDKDGVLRYLNKRATSRPANSERKIGVNIKECHAKPESLEMIERIFEDFRQGRKEPHFYVSKSGNKVMKVPIFDENRNFIGVFSYSHPVGFPENDRTF